MVLGGFAPCGRRVTSFASPKEVTKKRRPGGEQMLIGQYQIQWSLFPIRWFVRISFLGLSRSCWRSCPIFCCAGWSTALLPDRASDVSGRALAAGVPARLVAGRPGRRADRSGGGDPQGDGAVGLRHAGLQCPRGRCASRRPLREGKSTAKQRESDSRRIMLLSRLTSGPLRCRRATQAKRGMSGPVV